MLIPHPSKKAKDYNELIPNPLRQGKESQPSQNSTHFLFHSVGKGLGVFSDRCIILNTCIHTIIIIKKEITGTIINKYLVSACSVGYIRDTYHW